MLTIYSASAGTGKTHTLTGQYMSLLFKGKEQHRHILAVTFTNKATAEMKGRIIEELFNLADNNSSDFLDLLSENGKKSETEIRNQAKKILVTILHDYSAFNISTIDHFFQRTIRAFTREIGLQGNYRIEMNEEQMMEEAVENMLSKLEKSENSVLMDWLLRFTEDKIEDGGGWDIRRDIIKLGGQLFKETYKSHSDKINESLKEKQFLSDYRDELYRIVQSTLNTAKELGEKGVSLMKHHGLSPLDFKSGSRSPFLVFERLINGDMKEPSATFYGLVDNVDGYMAKTASPEMKQAAERIFSAGMNKLICGVTSFFDNLTDYYTANEITRNFYALGILTDLSQHIAKWREENNKMLIADTTELLNKVIDGSEIPFIYEKTGTRIEHYMIDEFQDTSGMQWSNFRPLLKDSLDSGKNNLIVGDVKQSIYRFRNSDWTLLDHKVKDEFKSHVIEENLETNWRSCRNIVEFNNMLFNSVPAILQNSFNEEIGQSSLPVEEIERFSSRIMSAYKNSGQFVAKPFADKDGHVLIQFLTDNEEQGWKEQSMERLPRIIEQLQDNGFELRDIAILTRTSAEGLLAAETLLGYKENHPDSVYKYDIISEDSLTVSSSLSVRWMVEMLKYLNRPDIKNNLSMAQMAYAMLRRKRQSRPDDVQTNEERLNKTLTDGICTNNDFNENVLSESDLFLPFPPEVMAKLKQLSNRSIYELTEGLFRLFENDFPDNELVFIQAFLDMVADYSANETGDTGRFLEWWDETGCGKKIITPDSQNAIRIMTIHKSKGLGFKAVIIPFAEWKVDQKDTILWCSPRQKPFDKMSLVPVKYSKSLKNTLFAADYLKEKLHSYIDNLNTLYVAFTRAKEELIVIAPQPKTEAASIAGLLLSGLMTDAEYNFDAENNIYERGTWWTPVAGKTSPVTEELTIERFYSVSPDKRMHLRLHKGVFQDDEKRKYGLLMHDILSRIEKHEDINHAVSEKYISGEICYEEAEILKKKLISITSESPVTSWFDGSMKVMNESEILFEKGQSRRPDRIMIDENNHVIVVDYKSGEQKEKSHQRQIEKYITLIREMGYQNIEGYLWYITLNEIEKCFF